jgi:heme/copper-type cytochrome/quinol oxidase subunit 4
MTPTSADATVNLRRYLTVFVSQLVLTGAAVLVSRLNLGVRTSVAAVMFIAVLNAGMVAFTLMGVRRDGRFVSIMALAVLVFVLGLLVWPAWDVYDRARMF